MTFVIDEWSFNFSTGEVKVAGQTNRFKIKKGRIYIYNGRWWDRHVGSIVGEVVSAYEHWQFERVVLR